MNEYFITLNSDKDLLKYVAYLKHRTQYIKIYILDRNEDVQSEIQGLVSAGSLSINAKSAIRRTGSITVQLGADAHTEQERFLEYQRISSLLALGNRVKLEIGYDNSGREYLEYDRFWFNIGTYVITKPQISHNAQGITATLTISDKMCLLNGEMGGTFSAGAVLTEYSSSTEAGAELFQVKLVDLIREMVVGLGEIPADKVQIEDVPEQILNIVRWNADEILYVYLDDTTSNIENDYIATTTRDNMPEDALIFKKHDIIGYAYTDFIYPGTLAVSPGETITSVLDKIKNNTGNYEYFFDVDGVFRFKEIDDLAYEGSPIDDLADAIQDKYFQIWSSGEQDTVWSFGDSELVTAYSNNPQFSLVKNDITVWGKNDLRYHVLIDVALDSETYQCIYKTDGEGVKRARRVRKKDDTIRLNDVAYSTWNITGFGDTLEWSAPEGYGKFKVNFNISNSSIYSYLCIGYSTDYKPISNSIAGGHEEIELFTRELVNQSYTLTFFDGEDTSNPRLIDWLYKNGTEVTTDLQEVTPIDPRTKLYYYYAAIRDSRASYNSELFSRISDLGAELLEWWPRIYDVQYQTSIEQDLTKLTYFFDIIDVNKLLNIPEVAQFSVSRVGRLKKQIKDDKINCIFSTKAPAIEYHNTNEGYQGADLSKGMDGYANMESDYYVNALIPGTPENPAYEKIRSALHEYLSYNNSITLTTMPIFFLDVNKLIQVENMESDIHGRYKIQTISIPFTVDGMMTITATKAVERI